MMKTEFKTKSIKSEKTICYEDHRSTWEAEAGRQEDEVLSPACVTQ